MTDGRVHLLAQAAYCYEQAGRLIDAARCRESAQEPAKAAELYRTAGVLTKAAACYRKAGRIGDAASCLLTLGRPEDAAELWEQAGDRLEAAWILVAYARLPQRAYALLDGPAPAGAGAGLRHRIAVALCAALEGRPAALTAVLGEAEEGLPAVTPASEQARLEEWGVRAAGHIGRPDLAAQIFGAAYRSRLRGTTVRWRSWARSALGGTAGIPERDL